jgi:hypothetical protein
LFQLSLLATGSQSSGAATPVVAPLNRNTMCLCACVCVCVCVCVCDN